MTTTSADITAETLDQLAISLRGELIVPGGPGYDAVRAVYNGMIDKHPAAIARCRDVADVITCVRFGRDHGIELAVRGGGHNAAGLGVADAALVVDLSLLRSTTVDPANHTVRADADCTWGDVLMDEGQDRIKTAYRGNYGRLAQIKKRYDPDNIFHLNQNIQPGSQG